MLTLLKIGPSKRLLVQIFYDAGGEFVQYHFTHVRKEFSKSTLVCCHRFGGDSCAVRFRGINGATR